MTAIRLGSVALPPLHPQNHQLIDISGEKMELVYDMPLPLGEPHYAVSIAADKLKPAVRYKSGWNSRTDSKSPYKTRAGREKTERTCDADGKCTVHVYGTTIRSHITPEIIEVTEGDTVSLVIMDHPSNLNHPTYWHARTYGLFSANPFGVKDFTRGEDELNFNDRPPISHLLWLSWILNIDANEMAPAIYIIIGNNMCLLRVHALSY